MSYISTNKKTPLKRKNQQLTDLHPDDYVMLRSGKKLAVDIIPMVGQSLKIVMTGDDREYGLTTGDIFYIYTPDWDKNALFTKEPVTADSVLIDKVPYYAQNDTSSDGGRMCCAHANAMMCAFLSGREYTKFVTNQRYRDQPELVYIDRMRKFGDSTDHNVQTQTLKTFGIESYWSDQISPVRLHESLLTTFVLPNRVSVGDRVIKGVPVVAGLKYKNSGHIVLIKGYKGTGYIVNDPNGKRDGFNDYYFQKSTNKDRVGENDLYSKTVMDAVFWDMGKENGYGRIVLAVDGVSTGLS
jgi:hypothetical protein